MIAKRTLNARRYARRLHRQGRVALSLETTEWHTRICDGSYAFASTASARIAERHMRTLAAILGLDMTWTPYREVNAPGLYCVQSFFFRRNESGGFVMSAGRYLKACPTRKRLGGLI